MSEQIVFHRKMIYLFKIVYVITVFLVLNTYKEVRKKLRKMLKYFAIDKYLLIQNLCNKL